jgi:hypothetical protein
VLRHFLPIHCFSAEILSSVLRYLYELYAVGHSEHVDQYKYPFHIPREELCSGISLTLKVKNVPTHFIDQLIKVLITPHMYSNYIVASPIKNNTCIQDTILFIQRHANQMHAQPNYQSSNRHGNSRKDTPRNSCRFWCCNLQKYMPA